MRTVPRRTDSQPVRFDQHATSGSFEDRAYLQKRFFTDGLEDDLATHVNVDSDRTIRRFLPDRKVAIAKGYRG